jgi:hypothetical protein
MAHTMAIPPAVILLAMVAVVEGATKTITTRLWQPIHELRVRRGRFIAGSTAVCPRADGRRGLGGRSRSGHSRARPKPMEHMAFEQQLARLVIDHSAEFVH